MLHAGAHTAFAFPGEKHCGELQLLYLTLRSARNFTGFNVTSACPFGPTLFYTRCVLVLSWLHFSRSILTTITPSFLPNVYGLVLAKMLPNEYNDFSNSPTLLLQPQHHHYIYSAASTAAHTTRYTSINNIMSSPNPVSSVPSLSQTSSSSNLQPSNPTPPVSIARGPNPARKRGRDEIDDDDVLSSDNDVLMTGVHAPVTSPEMSRSMDGAQATPPSSMPASPITAALQNMMATGQGEPAVVKNPTPGSATWAGNEDENAHKRTNRQSAPATDQSMFNNLFFVYNSRPVPRIVIAVSDS